MSKKTIAKICIFVILAFVVSSCGADKRGTRIDEANSAYQPAKVVGNLDSDEIGESSGLAASVCQPNVLWTHNDSGDGPYIYAIDLKGKTLGVWKVTGAENEDWEDIDAVKTSSGECFIYIGEIGNTDKLERTQHAVYRIKEPTVSADNNSGSSKNALATDPAEKTVLRYPDGSHDAETLLVRPDNGDIYILTKTRKGPSLIYKVVPAFGSENASTVTKIGELSVPAVPNGVLTGGAVSPDGKRVILCDYSAAYELSLPDGVSNFDEIWKQQPMPVSLGTRKQGEAITYSANGRAIFATSEGRGAPVIEVDRKQ